MHQKLHVSHAIITLYHQDNAHAHKIINSPKQQLGVDKNVIEIILLLNQIIFVYLIEELNQSLNILILITYHPLIILDIHHLSLFQIYYNIQTLTLFLKNVIKIL